MTVHIGAICVVGYNYMPGGGGGGADEAGGGGGALAAGGGGGGATLAGGGGILIEPDVALGLGTERDVDFVLFDVELLDEDVAPAGFLFVVVFPDEDLLLLFDDTDLSFFLSFFGAA
jgi:hypothetical protein